jgi:hypothetical protein
MKTKAPSGSEADTQALEGELILASKTPVKRKRFRLTTARGIRRELAGVYDQFRNGDIDSDTAKTATYILRTCGELLRLDEIEQRITQLENRE